MYEETINRLAEYNPIQITISVSSIAKNLWMESFSLNEDSYDIAISSFDRLNRVGIRPTASLVPMPSWFGYEDIENTFIFLKGKIDKIVIYSPGYTSYTNSSIVDKLKFNMNEMIQFLDDMSCKHDIYVDWSLHPKLPLQVNPDSISRMLNIAKSNNHTIWFLTSVSAYDRFKELAYRAATGLKVDYEVIKVENESYGGNIICSGLWLIKDVKKKIDEELKKGIKPNLIVVPGAFLDKYGYDLSGNNFVDFKEDYEREGIFFHVGDKK